MKPFTELVQFDPAPSDPYQPTSTPIYQTATFELHSIDEGGLYDYTRSGNPTRSVLEKQIAKLEQGSYGFALNSGMAAIHCVLGLLKRGDHVIASDDLYGGSYRLFTQRLQRQGIIFSFVDTTSLSVVKRAIQANTRLIFIETPSNPLQKMTDIRAVAKIAKEKNILFVVDNTFLSPWLQQPLLLGADIVIHSATKHLAGHSDVTAGLIILNHPEIAEQIAFIQNAEGTALAPFECWLLLRGLKTLGLRIERQQCVAKTVAHFLKNHPIVKKLYYPGFKDHPGYDIHHNQAKGPGTVISFTTDSLRLSKSIIDKIQLFTLSVSFGSLNSFISLPCAMSHASIPKNDRKLPEDLIRLSIGIKDPEDLIADLTTAMQQMTQKKHLQNKTTTLC